MDLREIGAMLREERERKGLSIDAVSDTIKITRTCLAAIEEGNESALPHPVYARGFIRNYARLLGIDQEEFAKSLAEAYQLEDAPLREVPLIRDIPDEDGGCGTNAGGRLRLGRVAIVLVALVLLAGVGWYLFTHFVAKPAGDAPVAEEKAAVQPPVTSIPSRPAPEAVSSEPVAPPTPVAKAPVPEPRAEAKPPVETTPLGEVKPQKPEPTPEDRATQDIATSGPAAPAASAIPSAQESVPSASAKTFTVGDHGSHVVSIVANERCWLQAGADGGPMHDSMLEKGDAFTGRFADYLLVRLGNAGAVEIRFDNKLYPLQAGKGAVKTLKFVAKKGEDEAAKPQAPAETPAPPVAAPPAVRPEAPAAVAPTPNPPAGETSQAAKEVEIYGQDGSWIIVSPDKGPAKELYVKKGQRITVPFGEKIEIRLGNPSNVIFRYDGKETPVTTEKGASKSVRFP
jgi:cytoskeleton protein RodZ